MFGRRFRLAELRAREARCSRIRQSEPVELPPGAHTQHLADLVDGSELRGVFFVELHDRDGQRGDCAGKDVADDERHVRGGGHLDLWCREGSPNSAENRKRPSPPTSIRRIRDVGAAVQISNLIRPTSRNQLSRTSNQKCSDSRQASHAGYHDEEARTKTLMDCGHIG